MELFGQKPVPSLWPLPPWVLVLLTLCRQPAPAPHSRDQTQWQLGKQLGAKLEKLFK